MGARSIKPDAGTRRITMVAYDQAQILDITGPLEVFSRSSRLLAERGGRRRPAYEVEIIAQRAGSLRTSSGIELNVRRTLAQTRAVDTLLVTGGLGFDAAAATRRCSRRSAAWRAWRGASARSATAPWCSPRPAC